MSEQLAVIHFRDTFKALLMLQLKLAQELTPSQFESAMNSVKRVQRRMLLLEQELTA